jgi:NitT/TauT family transport system substrate-binding protein
MRRRFLRAISVTTVGLSVVLGAGCGSPGSGPPKVSGLEKTSLTVGAVPVADEAGLYIAQDEGLFAAEGLHVTIDPILSSADATKGQNSGKFDITAGNVVSYVQDQVSHRSDLQIVAEGSLMQPDNQALYTLPGSPVTTIADLKGRRIGVNVLNNIGTLLISSVLQEHGLSARDVHFVPVPFPALGQALKRHLIDVAWLPEPTASADAESMGLAELTDLNQGATEGFPVGWYVVTKTWGEEVPADAGGVPRRAQAGPADRRQQPDRRGAGDGEAARPLYGFAHHRRRHVDRKLSAEHRAEHRPAKGPAGGQRDAPVPHAEDEVPGELHAGRSLTG